MTPPRSLQNHSFKGGSEVPASTGEKAADGFGRLSLVFRVDWKPGAKFSRMGNSSPVSENWKKGPVARTGPAIPGSCRNSGGGSQIRQEVWRQNSGTQRDASLNLLPSDLEQVTVPSVIFLM